MCAGCCGEKAENIFQIIEVNTALHMNKRIHCDGKIELICQKHLPWHEYEGRSCTNKHSQALIMGNALTSVSGVKRSTV